MCEYFMKTFSSDPIEIRLMLLSNTVPLFLIVLRTLNVEFQDDVVFTVIEERYSYF